MNTLVQGTENRDAVLMTVIQHWAKARIESPLHLISRFDDTAKQIITVAGLLQGALIAIVKIDKDAMTIFGLAAAIMLLVTIVLAAFVIRVPPDDMWAHQLYEDLRCSRDDSWMERQLDGRFKEWCTAVSQAATRKRKILTASILTLTLGLMLCVGCLLETYGGPTFP